MAPGWSVSSITGKWRAIHHLKDDEWVPRLGSQLYFTICLYGYKLSFFYFFNLFFVFVTISLLLYNDFFISVFDCFEVSLEL